MSDQLGVLTAGGDSPGLNAAIRGIGKAAIRQHGMTVIGFRDGFKGLMQNRFVRFDAADLSGILTLGGTILGTSREKPHKMEVGGRRLDMTDLMMENYKGLHGKLGAEDRQKMDEYLESVRALEQRVERTSQWTHEPLPKVDTKGLSLEAAIRIPRNTCAACMTCSTWPCRPTRLASPHS